MKLVISSIPLFLLLLCLRYGESKETKRCLGTNSGYSVAEDRMDHLTKLINRYTNCTIVQGNLEIAGLEDSAIDASFLQDIEVVTGYVLIAINYIEEIPLPKLKIIRGQELYGSQQAALHIAANYARERPSVGLKRIHFQSLTEIQKGNVRIVNNNMLCFTDTINWLDIMNPAARKQDGWTFTVNNTTPGIISTKNCSACNESCNGHCWGPGAEDCQILTSTICHPNCGDSRCRGPGRDECCDRECACGCVGPTDRDCIACLHMNNSGVCQMTCPPRYIYHPQTSRNVKNPNFKYHFNEMCVDKCPSNMLVEDNGCVKHCRKGQHNNGTGVCVRCTGNECNKECFGVGNPDGPLNQSETVDSKNVHFFEGCNIVRGNVIFQSYAFSGDNHTDTPPMTAEQVVKAFSGVKVINGYLMILSWPEEFNDFSVFSNLTTIMGIDLFRNVVSMLVQDSIAKNGPFYLSHVESLGFRSLTSINFGNVYIGYMKNLCYSNVVDWGKIIKHPVQHRSFSDKGVLLRANVGNCENITCHPACGDSGCWGPTTEDCISCKNLSYNGVCAMECDKSLGIYQEGNTCLPCHSECRDTCHGPGNGNCTTCKHFEDDGYCVEACPFNKYGDYLKKRCMPCDAACIGHSPPMPGPMCSGPNTTLGPGGCEYCDTIMADHNLRNRECLPASRKSCPDAHFVYANVGLRGTLRACVPCAKGCLNCTGYAEADCIHSLPVKSDTIIILVVVVSIVVLGLVCLTVFLVHHRKQKLLKKRQMSMRALGLEGGGPEPMTPSGVAPNKAQLRIVKENELQTGKILGSGAFGTVHNGYWIPDLVSREKVRVPVAIKVLRDESSQVASNEILDEAFVMASCEHPNLARLLGISLSQRVMLITQLMPLGNLLEYVRDNKDSIGSQILLNWCLQIAKGMCYLAEEKHLVHRDLAARNVLVKSPNHVRITDFGLAKLLDVNEDVYRADGGKMPIKWLALESIQHRLFTQKSDVWSFGVTVWELMTFGKKPYENVPAREVHTLLERGERLLQPTTCTIDIYMLMIKCWTVDPESRPTFRELVDEFSKMARDPKRYIVIPNDENLPALPSPTYSEFFRSLNHDAGDVENFPLQDAEDYLGPARETFAEHATANGGHFPLQPAPTTAQWRKQEEPRPPGYPGRFGGSHISSTADSRLDSAVTVMTSLPSDSSSYPNSNYTPLTPGANMTPLSREGFPVFARSNSRQSRDQIPSVNGAVHQHPATRTTSESSDVFLNPPTTQLKDAWDEVAMQPFVPEHAGVVRPREDSATMRYCAEPVLGRQESLQNELQSRGSADLQEDQDGYLEPSDIARRSPEYLDPITYPNSSPCFTRSLRRKNPLSAQLSAGMENPEYEPTFMPVRNGFSAGSHNLIDRQSSIPIKDDDGYEVPMAGLIETRRRRLSTEYENINAETGFPDVSGDLEEDEHGYLTVNHRMLARRRDSHSGESTSSEKRDSGMQSEGDDEADPLNSKNVKAAGDRYYENDDTTDPSAGDNNHVDNPNYELLENMTDGGFKPMSEFSQSSAGRGEKSPCRKNPLQLTIDCHAIDDLEDNIFVTPEAKRRGAKNPLSEDRDGLFETPETKRKDFDIMLPDYDEDAETGRFVPRTYSEPDSGVGIEVGIDNALYHRLGSSGWEGFD